LRLIQTMADCRADGLGAVFHTRWVSPIVCWRHADRRRSTVRACVAALQRAWRSMCACVCAYVCIYLHGCICVCARKRERGWVRDVIFTSTTTTTSSSLSDHIIGDRRCTPGWAHAYVDPVCARYRGHATKHAQTLACNVNASISP
jgi:hypothetical protein